MKRIVTLLFLLPFWAIGQSGLLPHIGLSSPPTATDSICPIPVYQGDMDTTGYLAGDTVADFTLYKTNGDSVRLADLLNNGLPVLLVGGNLTCPVFRNKLPDLNNMANFYNGLCQVYIVYTVEAHPIFDPSPYSGQVWVTSQNQNDGILFPQPQTYGERFALVDSLQANYNVIPELLVDGPCNEWWTHYGPAPNNAYLIDTNGVVNTKHGWFHRAPQNMWCALDSLLGTTSGNCSNVGFNGSFTLTLDSLDSTAYGQPLDVLAIHATIENTSLTDNVEIRIQKLVQQVPVDWQTALCADVCYLPTVDSVDIVVPPNSTQPFTFYFYTGTSPDSGFVRVGFRNNYFPQNRYRIRFGGYTEDRGTFTIEGSDEAWSVGPNPGAGLYHLATNPALEGQAYRIFNMKGMPLLQGVIEGPKQEIDLQKEASGIYLIELGGRGYRTLRLIKN